jgi:hypothetical protein
MRIHLQVVVDAAGAGRVVRIPVAGPAQAAVRDAGRQAARLALAEQVVADDRVVVAVRAVAAFGEVSSPARVCCLETIWSN